jgi:hypothetical protein
VSTTEDGRIAGPWLGGAAGIVGLVVEGAYLVIISGQGDLRSGRVSAVSVCIFVASGLALVGALAPSLSTRTRLVVLGAATGGLLTLGVLGIFSIGLPLLVAGVLCGVAWRRFARAARSVPAGAPLLSSFAAIFAGGLVVFGVAIS